tara:strand:+ start:1402 stop:1887 length:486 start_codon:yes stop_codon:yes gene_type:complete
MWIVLKINKNEFNTLMTELNDRLNGSFQIYVPKVSYQKKILKKEIFLLGDYIFCFSTKFKEKTFIYSIKFCKGLKEVLIGKEISQKEIINFIQKCKNYEIEDGTISYNFFKILENHNYKFLSGPFSDYLAQAIKVQKEKIDLLIGNFKVSLKKRKYFLHSQ